MGVVIYVERIGRCIEGEYYGGFGEQEFEVPNSGRFSH